MIHNSGSRIERPITASRTSTYRHGTVGKYPASVPPHDGPIGTTLFDQPAPRSGWRHIGTVRADPRLFKMAMCGIAAFMLACAAGCWQSAETNNATAQGEPPHGLRLVDLDGTIVDPLKEGGGRAHVFLFTRTDCPISNRYAPEVRRLCELFQDQNVEFCLVYPDPDQTADDVRRHVDQYGYVCRALHDPNHDLVKLTGAQITPEAAVFDSNGQMVYRGRIDDRYVDFGKARAEATQHDLLDALQAVVEGQPVPNPRTKSVGCYIVDLK